MKDQFPRSSFVPLIRFNLLTVARPPGRQPVGHGSIRIGHCGVGDLELPLMRVAPVLTRLDFVLRFCSFRLQHDVVFMRGRTWD